MGLIPENPPKIELKFKHTENWDYPMDKLKSQRNDGRVTEPWRTSPKKNAMTQYVSPGTEMLI